MKPMLSSSPSSKFKISAFEEDDRELCGRSGIGSLGSDIPFDCSAGAGLGGAGESIGFAL